MNKDEEVPALIAYLSPFQIVETPEIKWECTIDQVNSTSYDYGKLAKLVGSIDVGLGTPFCLHIGHDGALVLPLLERLLPVERAADFFNRFLAAICIGGIYSDAVGPEDVEHCRVLNGRIAWYFGPGKSFQSVLHGGLKYKEVGNLMSIILVNPRKIEFGDLVEAHYKGASILNSIPSLTPEFLIRGLSAMRSRTWSNALAELWICIEQMTTVLWDRALEPMQGVGGKARRDLLGNHQSWTTSVRQEVLFQRGMLDGTTYGRLMSVRKARNALSHDGKPATKDQAIDCCVSTIRLMGILMHDNPSAFDELIPPLHSHPHQDHAPAQKLFDQARRWRPVGGLANSSLHSEHDSSEPNSGKRTT